LIFVCFFVVNEILLFRIGSYERLSFYETACTISAYVRYAPRRASSSAPPSGAKGNRKKERKTQPMKDGTAGAQSDRLFNTSGSRVGRPDTTKVRTTLQPHQEHVRQHEDQEDREHAQIASEQSGTGEDVEMALGQNEETMPPAGQNSTNMMKERTQGVDTAGFSSRCEVCRVKIHENTRKTKPKTPFSTVLPRWDLKPKHSTT
jgi:hypothetical protein